MKTLISIVTLGIALTTPALAHTDYPTTKPTSKTELPFVGEALFSFGGNASEQHIRINADGQTTITENTRLGSTVVYQGAYQPYLPITQNGKTVGFYAIKGDTIHELDASKQPNRCATASDDNALCVAELEQLTNAD